MRGVPCVLAGDSRPYELGTRIDGTAIGSQYVCGNLAYIPYSSVSRTPRCLLMPHFSCPDSSSPPLAPGKRLLYFVAHR